MVAVHVVSTAVWTQNEGMIHSVGMNQSLKVDLRSPHCASTVEVLVCLLQCSDTRSTHQSPHSAACSTVMVAHLHIQQYREYNTLLLTNSDGLSQSKLCTLKHNEN